MKFLEPMIVAFSMYSKIPMPRIEWNKEIFVDASLEYMERTWMGSNHLSGRNVS